MSEVYEKYFGDKPASEMAATYTTEESVREYVDKMIAEKYADDVMGADFIASQLWQELEKAR